MRKHIDYYYKCYDGDNYSKIDKICNEKFNDYGYNFDCNNRKVINYDELICKKMCLKEQERLFSSKKVN